MTFSCEPKLMAKRLRASLAARDIPLSHGQCLELVAQQHGFKDWNTAAAAIETNAANCSAALHAISQAIDPPAENPAT